MKGQLTGIPRQIKDSVADIYNNVQKWKKLNAQGFEQLTRVCDLKLAMFVPIEPFEQLELKQTPVYRYSEKLNTACQHLVITLNSIQAIASSFCEIAAKFNKLTKLASFNSSIDDEPNNIPFISWPMEQFASHAQEISDVFANELLVKQCIVESAAHVDHGKTTDDVAQLSHECRDILMTYSSCWLHEPYVNENSLDVLIEGLLYETGHAS